MLSGGLTYDLDVHGGAGVAGHVLGLHGHPVDAGGLVAVLDGLVRHRQVLVDGPHAVAQVHLVARAAGVALTPRTGDTSCSKVVSCTLYLA